MELTNEFTVSVPVDEAWAVLTDLERIAPCMPGAQLQEVEGDEFRGIVKVKVGPITAQYKGAASFQERDDATHRAVIKAEGVSGLRKATSSRVMARVRSAVTVRPSGGRPGIWSLKRSPAPMLKVRWPSSSMWILK